MNTPEQILEAARRAPKRLSAGNYLEAVQELRAKNWSWREIASFLREQGVETDHSKLIRLVAKAEGRWRVPDAKAYGKALAALRSRGQLASPHWDMLMYLYRAHNRTCTYTELALAARAAGASVSESRPHTYANLEFGKLGKLLGEELKMQFLPSTTRESLFYSSSIGVSNSATPDGCEFELVMHHELAKALDAMLGTGTDKTA